MNQEKRRSVEANLFPQARSAIEEWDTFPWHNEVWRPNSSQALAIDVFGFLRQSDARDVVLDALAAELGLPTGATWNVKPEWCDKDNCLNEKRAKTQIDAVARSDKSLIFFECKFTEATGGPCSQTRPVERVLKRALYNATGITSLSKTP
jgi:hypothetical protein